MYVDFTSTILIIISNRITVNIIGTGVEIVQVHSGNWDLGPGSLEWFPNPQPALYLMIEIGRSRFNHRIKIKIT